MTADRPILLITGASGGIGTATVEVFRAAGWRVIGVDRNDPGVPVPGADLFIRADVSDPQQIDALFGQVGGFTSVLSAVVNNAAVQVARPALETTVEEWDTVMASNLRAAFLVAQQAHPFLKAGGGGAIVNVSSVHAIQTSANIAAYAASKGGLLALTRALAIEFAPDNIRVNAVLPGAVDTHMLRAGLQRGHVSGNSVDVRLEQLARRTVIGRVGRPEEIARAILFLADPSQSSFMTGQSLVVDGGATARLSTE